MIVIAVNILATTPIPSVTANPLIVPIPDKYSTTQVMIVVTLESRIAEKAFLKPESTDAFIVFPRFISSFILSNMITFASTAIPIERTIPAIPERLKFILNMLKIHAMIAM